MGSEFQTETLPGFPKHFDDLVDASLTSVSIRRDFGSPECQRRSDYAPKRARLDALLAGRVDDRLTRFVWLLQFEVDGDSSGAARLLDRLAFLQGLELSPDALSGNPPHPPA